MLRRTSPPTRNLQTRALPSWLPALGVSDLPVDQLPLTTWQNAPGNTGGPEATHASNARSHRHSSVGAVLGIFGGMFVGGVVGSKLERLEGPCGCDDPGLKGILVGAPVGAIVGGILGARSIL